MTSPPWPGTRGRETSWSRVLDATARDGLVADAGGETAFAASSRLGHRTQRPARASLPSVRAGRRRRLLANGPHDLMNDHDPDPEGLPVTTLLADRYRLVSLLGSGGMADVYLAEDERLGRRVAVKVLKARLAADDEFRERFRIEAQAAASLKHPSIVAVYDRGTADGVPYIAMEYVHGESLKQRVRRDGALPSNEAVDVALNVLSALAAAHDRSIVHRDVTSYNVLLEEGGRVVVTDFGIARMGDSALTHTGAMMGTSSYLSPEQAQGRPADRARTSTASGWCSTRC